MEKQKQNYEKKLIEQKIHFENEMRLMEMKLQKKMKSTQNVAGKKMSPDRKMSTVWSNYSPERKSSQGSVIPRRASSTMCVETKKMRKVRKAEKIKEEVDECSLSEDPLTPRKEEISISSTKKSMPGDIDLVEDETFHLPPPIIQGNLRKIRNNPLAKTPKPEKNKFIKERSD